MAIDIPNTSRGTTNYLQYNVGLGITGAPYTLHARANPDDLTSTHDAGGILGLYDSGSPGNRAMFYAGLSGDATAHFNRRYAGNITAGGATSMSAGTWYSMCAVVFASDSWAIYTDNDSPTVNTNNVTGETTDRVTIGRFDDSSASNGYNGKVQDAAIWSVALTSDERAALASGASPLLVRPSKLLFYVPLHTVGDVVCRITGTTPTTGGSPTTVVGDRVVYPAWPISITRTAAAGGDVTVTPTAAALALTGASASVALKINKSLAVASLALAGEQPTVSVVGGAVDVVPTSASLALTGASATVSLIYGITPTAAALSITGEQPSVSVLTGVDVQPTAASLALTGATASVSLKYGLSINAASLSLTGEAAAYALKKNISFTAAALALTGEATSYEITADKLISPNAGTLALTGASPTVNLKYNISPTGAVLALTGETLVIEYPGSTTTTARSGGGRGSKRRAKWQKKVVIDGRLYVVNSPLELRQLLEAHEQKLEARLEDAPTQEVRSLKRQITITKKKIEQADTAVKSWIDEVMDDDEEVVELWAMLH